MTDPYAPIWCATCGVHYALPHLKHCPACLDERDRARKDNR